MSKRRDATECFKLTFTESEVEHSPGETGLVIGEPGDQVDQGEQTGGNKC